MKSRVVGLAAVVAVLAGICATTSQAGEYRIIREVVAAPTCVIPEPPCPPAPLCCEDSKICVRVDNDKVCYTEKGLHAFVGLWREAAVKAIENATVRAFNGTAVAAPCVPCEKVK